MQQYVTYEISAITSANDNCSIVTKNHSINDSLETTGATSSNTTGLLSSCNVVFM